MKTNYFKPVTVRFNLSVVAVLFLAVFALVLAQAGVAFAHAHLKSSTILPNATVTTVPATLALTFDEETSPTETRLQVVDASGKAVDKGDLKVNGATATVSLGTLADGKYTVNYRSFTEDDGGIVTGSFSFTVAKSGAAAAGNLSTASETESKAPGAPDTGIGGGTEASSTSPLGPVFGLVAVGLLAGAGLLVSLRRHQGR